MMKYITLPILFLLIMLCSCTESKVQTEGTKVPLELGRLFSDHMVLQRGIDLQIYGTGTPNVLVQVDIAGNQSNGNIMDDGGFNITLPPLKAGGPYELTISTPDTIIKIIDVLLGDIWVCSGQSNMEFEIHESKNGEEALNAQKSNQIRLINIPTDMEFTPLSDFRKEMKWLRADVDTINKFSAVGYYFGLVLEQKLGVPIGLIASNLGGTTVASWMETEALDSIAYYRDKVDFVRTNTMSIEEIDTARDGVFVEMKDSLFAQGIGMEEEWFLPNHNIEGWQDINVPGFWEDQIPGLKNHDGVVWYRKEFDTNEAFDDKDMKIWLSQIQDYDIAWLNGVKIGETYSPQGWRGYSADKSIVKRKNNVLVVRVYNRRNRGGFAGISSYFDYYPEGAKIHAKSLSGVWKYKATEHIDDFLDLPISANVIGPNDYPSLLYNAMINPMIKFPIKGVIWYQGEADASRAYLYRKTFPALINNWRSTWNIGDFPFYFVQLANFGPEEEQFGNSFWAELREAQHLTRSLANTGMTTIIDIGNSTDIHPKNKTDVGGRLAFIALDQAYGIPTSHNYPTFSELTIEGSKASITFEHIGSGLMTNDGKSPNEFIMAGTDQIFYEAVAKIEGNKISLSCPKVDHPVSVRYAWKNSPNVNLFNKEGFPMAPFRTDNWKMTTNKGVE